MKPLEERRVRSWTTWPQMIAPHSTCAFRKRIRSGPGCLRWLLLAANRLSETTDPPIPFDKMVVFYPKKSEYDVGRGIRRWRDQGKLKELAGLTVCATSHLRGICMAFRIEDVEAHRTPADAYFVRAETPSGPRELNPIPVYTEEESELGERIDE